MNTTDILTNAYLRIINETRTINHVELKDLFQDGFSGNKQYIATQIETFPQQGMKFYQEQQNNTIIDFLKKLSINLYYQRVAYEPDPFHYADRQKAIDALPGYKEQLANLMHKKGMRIRELENAIESASKKDANSAAAVVYKKKIADETENYDKQINDIKNKIADLELKVGLESKLRSRLLDMYIKTVPTQYLKNYDEETLRRYTMEMLKFVQSSLAGLNLSSESPFSHMPVDNRKALLEMGAYLTFNDVDISNMNSNAYDFNEFLPKCYLPKIVASVGDEKVSASATAAFKLTPMLRNDINAALKRGLSALMMCIKEDISPMDNEDDTFEDFIGKRLASEVNNPVNTFIIKLDNKILYYGNYDEVDEDNENLIYMTQSPQDWVKYIRNL